MQNIKHSWCIQIDITNKCGHGCTYCSRYNGHLRVDQRADMTLEEISIALDSLKEWPTVIGIIGGEPILHPQFLDICKLIQSKFPKTKMGLWTSGGKFFNEYKSEIDKTFCLLAYNEHNPEQQETCRHQPLTIAIDEVIHDEDLKQLLIDNCWVQRTWCATINKFGAYFCEVAAAQDYILNNGTNAWPVIPRWWDKEPSEFSSQRNKLCGKCGMAIPMERDLIKNKIEKFSPMLLQAFRLSKLRNLEDEKVCIFDKVFTKQEIIENSKTWTPGNYRGDLFDDLACPEGNGIDAKL